MNATVREEVKNYWGSEIYAADGYSIMLQQVLGKDVPFLKGQVVTKFKRL